MECCDCGKSVPGDTSRPVYRVKATGKTIKPNPRCADCLAKYEAPKLAADGGLEKIQA